MPYPLDVDSEADLNSGLLATVDLVDFYLKDLASGDPAFLRAWNWPGEALYPANDPESVDGAVGATDVTYETMHQRMVVPMGLQLSASLTSVPLTITLDGSRTGDDEDFVGRFFDREYHQCRMRVRRVLMSRVTGNLRESSHDEWHGLINLPNQARQKDNALVWQIECQGGLFRTRGRRMRTRTHEDQQKRLAGDLFYQGTPLMVGVPLLWNKATAALPAVVTNNGAPVTGGNTYPPLFKNQNRDQD